MSTLISYQSGFGNHFESEAIPGALIKSRNSPQHVPMGLYAEQLSGSAFTMQRHLNLFSWLYRIRPSVLHEEFKLIPSSSFAAEYSPDLTPPTQMRWDPMPYLDEPVHFINGLRLFAGNGSSASHTGAALYLYCATQSMINDFFYDADGELLIVPQEGKLLVKTELGFLDVAPGEMVVIPRGIKFQVHLLEQKARGYVCENFGAPFRLPELGFIGANGLANPRNFLAPTAAYDDTENDFHLLVKFQQQLWQAKIRHSPLDVVAWHGNYTPYKYDLRLFNTINSVSYDHPDPSIFTVLTSSSPVAGMANVDFVIFPARWMVAEETFRPPYFHRNIMSEFMGLIYGNYDAKETGFLPGGCSLHNCMSAHGPDSHAYHKAIASKLEPVYYDNTLAFMFESRHSWNMTSFALHASFRQKDYLACWQNLPHRFQTCA